MSKQKKRKKINEKKKKTKKRNKRKTNIHLARLLHVFFFSEPGLSARRLQRSIASEWDSMLNKQQLPTTKTTTTTTTTTPPTTNHIA
jgi:hypothetical protein